MGTFSTAATPEVMLTSMSQVLGWKLALYDRDPGGRQVLTSAGGSGARWPAGTAVTFDTVSGGSSSQYAGSLSRQNMLRCQPLPSRRAGTAGVKARPELAP